MSVNWKYELNVTNCMKLCLQLPTVNNARDIKFMLLTLSDISLILSFEATSSLDNFVFYNVENIHVSNIEVIFVGPQK